MRSITIEFHGWEGMNVSHDELDSIFKIGFLTLFISTRRVSSRIRHLQMVVAQMDITHRQ